MSDLDIIKHFYVQFLEATNFILKLSDIRKPDGEDFQILASSQSVEIVLEICV